ncbi:hypothetical protein PR048_015054 [Dryococelus australis]|uniref:Protein kinase domain-containing protein n=1 Tax=Dryococelus australis TaxID=614101 RepID=A0ABQ9HFY7_9NEOP|nr:hypothetical protein PR048_015054 [Dryococelus australis]
MAPEVVRATPGAFASINCSKANIWAVGATAYEMFGIRNCFYSTRDTGKPLLYSYRNQDSELPKLHDCVPPLVQSIVIGMLKSNQS